MAFRTPFAATTPIARSAAATETAKGFSQMMALPWRAADSTISACEPGGEQMSTTSTSDRSTTSRQSSVQLSKPRAAEATATASR
jgi:hypothetical protein